MSKKHTSPCTAGFYWVTNRHGQSIPVQVYADQRGSLWFCWAGSSSPIAVVDSNCTWSERIYPPKADAPDVLQQRDELLEICEEALELLTPHWNVVVERNCRGGRPMAPLEERMHAVIANVQPAASGPNAKGKTSE